MWLSVLISLLLGIVVEVMVNKALVDDDNDGL
jgi:hypothetical protein